MRKVARVRAVDGAVRWIIVHEAKDGVFVFPCAKDDDGSATGDAWFSSLSDADAHCASAYRVEAADWQLIRDPLPGCQQDWVAPVRVRERAGLGSQRRRFECLVDGVWLPVDAMNPPLSIERAMQQTRAVGGALGSADRSSDTAAAPLDEAGFWEALEYRVSHALAGVEECARLGMWCDGFIAHAFELEASPKRIFGQAWVCFGSRQERWTFELLLPDDVERPDAIVWSTLLPAATATCWLTIDREGKHLVVAPADAVHLSA